MAAESTDLAALALFLVSGATATEWLGVQREAARVAEAKTVLFASDTELDFLVVTGRVGTAASMVHAAARVCGSFFGHVEL